MKENTKEIVDQLEQGVKDLFTSEAYAEHLRFVAKFHNYSLNNNILISMQCPTATYVAGFTAWKKLNRSVKKGEKERECDEGNEKHLQPTHWTNSGWAMG